MHKERKMEGGKYGWAGKPTKKKNKIGEEKGGTKVTVRMSLIKYTL